MVEQQGSLLRSYASRLARCYGFDWAEIDDDRRTALPWRVIAFASAARASRMRRRLDVQLAGQPGYPLGWRRSPSGACWCNEASRARRRPLRSPDTRAVERQGKQAAQLFTRANLRTKAQVRVQRIVGAPIHVPRRCPGVRRGSDRRGRQELHHGRRRVATSQSSSAASTSASRWTSPTEARLCGAPQLGRVRLAPRSTGVLSVAACTCPQAAVRDHGSRATQTSQTAQVIVAHQVELDRLLRHTGGSWCASARRPASRAPSCCSGSRACSPTSRPRWSWPSCRFTWSTWRLHAAGSSASSTACTRGRGALVALPAA